MAGHEGIDYGIPTGTPILTITDGKVVRLLFSSKDYGNFIVIWHPKLKIASWYCHLQKTGVNIGDEVIERQQIGLSGNTGNTTGAHLHLGICQTDENGYRINKNNGYQGFINPAPYFNNPNSQSSSALEECLKLHSELVSKCVQKDEEIKNLKLELEELKNENKSFITAFFEKIKNLFS